MEVEEVEALARRSDPASFGCYRPGNNPLVCEVGWRARDGIQCQFDKSGKLVGYRIFHLRPLTRVEILTEKSLCESD